MITIISGTNRRNSEALHFARHYQQIIAANTDETVELIALEDIPHDWFSPGMYEAETLSPSFIQLHQAYIAPANKYLFVAPEYNGSIPGALKLFLDACSILEYPMKNRKAALVGIASGRFGNLTGLEHLTSILLHFGAFVLPRRVAISTIEKLTDGAGNITDPATLRQIEKQVAEFLTF
jgi:NAD(P)H-dependent FMN reductase